MRVYRSISTYIWNDDKFPFASDDCQIVWFHLFTNPYSSPLGVFRASIAGLAEDKNRNGSWSINRYMKAFQEALQHGFVKVDTKALLISFPKYFSPANICNHPQSPNVVTSWGERFHDLPNSVLKLECYQSLKALLEGKGEAFLKAFLKAFGEVYPHPCPNTDPDSLFLIPDPKPDPERRRGNRNKSFAEASPSADTWAKYQAAYLERYGVEQVRNATTNAQMSAVVKRLGVGIAPEVAEFYVRHNNHFYVSQSHAVGLLLKDAESLHTQWRTGRTVTSSQARKIDQTQGRMNVFQELINERKGEVIDVQVT